ncbi:MAG: hypothetical protein ACFFD4_13365 [Candidatus Odinarchaeota archaeon]
MTSSPTDELLPHCPKQPRKETNHFNDVTRKRNILFLFFLLLLLLLPLSIDFIPVSPELQGTFMQSYGERWTDDNAQAVIQTPDGGYALAGGTWSYGAGNNDMWLVKTDSNGSLQWNKTYGGSGKDWASVIIKTDDGGFVLGGGTRPHGTDNDDMFLVKTDASGNEEWNRSYGGTGSESIAAIVQLNSGGYALTGSTTSHGAGNEDLFLVKTDKRGNEEWNRTYGGGGSDWGSAIVKTDDGGFVLAGTTGSGGAGSYDMWLVKTDGNGMMEWCQTYGGTEREWASSLVRTKDGGFALGGASWFNRYGPRDMFLVKTDKKGNEEWNRSYCGNGDENERCEDLIQTADGGFALGGIATTASGSGYVDIFLVKTDAAGEMEWNSCYGGSLHDTATALLQTADGGFVLAGITEATWFEPYYGGGDMWLVKTNGKGGMTVTERTATPGPGILSLLTAVILLTRRNVWKKGKKA